MKYILSMCLLLFVVGCGNGALDEKQLYSDAKDVYEAIKNNESDAHDLAEEFSNNYIESGIDYSEYDELILNMDKLINGHKFYYIALGLDETETAEKKKKDMIEALSSLEEQFNDK